MAGIAELATVVAAVLLVAAGLFLVSRSVHQLSRAGAFSSLYWASFRRYAGYRLRSLRPLALALLGLLMVFAGLTVLYVSLVAFYTGRLLTPA